MRPDDLQNQTGDTLACPRRFIPHSLSLSGSRTFLVLSQQAFFTVMQRKLAASFTSLCVLHNDDFECGMMKCFYSTFLNARESVPVQAQTKNVDHTETGVVKSPLFTSSCKQPTTRLAELR